MSNQTVPGFREFEPKGPWSTPTVEELFIRNTDKLRKAGFITIYLSEIIQPRRHQFINPGLEGLPMVLHEDISMNAMCDALLLAQVNTASGLVVPSTEIMVAFGNDELEWQLSQRYDDLDVSVLTDVVESTRNVGLMATNDTGTRAWG